MPGAAAGQSNRVGEQSPVAMRERSITRHDRIAAELALQPGGEALRLGIADDKNAVIASAARAIRVRRQRGKTGSRQQSRRSIMVMIRG